jgi:hypothetical protein
MKRRQKLALFGWLLSAPFSTGAPLTRLAGLTFLGSPRQASKVFSHRSTWVIGEELITVDGLIKEYDDVRAKEAAHRLRMKRQS